MGDRYTPIIDISDGTNLAVTAPIVLTNDTLSLNQGGVDHGSLAGLNDDDHGAIYIPYSSLATDIYTLDTASITLTAGTLTALDIIATNDIFVNTNGGRILIGANNDIEFTHNGSVGTLSNLTGQFSIVSSGGIVLAADSGNIGIIASGTTNIGAGSTMTLSADGVINLKPSDDNDDYIVFSTDINIPQIGPESDTNLLQLTINLLTVNGAVTGTGIGTFSEVVADTTGLNTEEVLKIIKPDLVGVGGDHNMLKEFGLALGDGIQYATGRGQIYGISAEDGIRVQFMQFRTQSDGVVNNIQFLADFVELANNVALSVTSADVGSVVPVVKITAGDIVQLGANFREAGPPVRTYPVELYYGYLNDTTDGSFKIIRKDVSSDIVVFKIDHLGNTFLGDGGDTNFAQISATGDLIFVGTAGLPFGECHQTDGATFDVTMTTVNVWAEVDAATTNISATDLNLVTFPDDHYLLCTIAGKYLVTYSFTAEIDSVAGGEQHVESGIMVNGSIQTDRGIGHEQYAAINKQRNLQGHAIIDVPTNGQISLALKNTTSSEKVLTIDHLNITVTQFGGT